MDYFRLKANKTDFKTEVLSGITTFATMSYILIVNPNVLSAAGMDKTGVFLATVLSSIVATLIMAFYAKLPFVLAPGLGMNTFFIHYVIFGLGFSWQTGLFATFTAGILVIMLLRFNLYEKLLIALPDYIKNSLVAGIGLAILMLGLKYSNIITVADNGIYSLAGLYSFQAFAATAGLIVTLVLLEKKTLGAILYGLLFTYMLGIAGQLAGWYIVNPEAGVYSLIPSFGTQGNVFDGFFDVAFQFPKFHEIFQSVGSVFSFCIVVFSMMGSHFFDAAGTQFALINQLKSSGKQVDPQMAKKAMYADAVGAFVGACIGTTTITTYAESSVGIESGARTGLSSVTVAICLAASLFLTPVVTAIPGFAIAPALLVAGKSLFLVVKRIDFARQFDAITAIVIIAGIGLSFNVYDSILYGITLHVICRLLAGQSHTIHKYTYILFGWSVANILVQMVMSS